ncbi:MAG: hypothetical protein WBV74_00675 [Pseudonocardiaceae bacterium]
MKSTRPTCGGDRNVGRVEFTDSAYGAAAPSSSERPQVQRAPRHVRSEQFRVTGPQLAAVRKWSASGSRCSSVAAGAPFVCVDPALEMVQRWSAADVEQLGREYA